MSIFTACKQAAFELLEHPDLVDANIFGGTEGVFTEYEVILRAARVAGGWDEHQMKTAQREANEAMGKLFRERKVVRYGLVKIPGISRPDYLRMEEKIVYAHPQTGPARVETPNGTYYRMAVHDDAIGVPGRREGSARNDFVPWDDQNVIPLSSREVRTSGNVEDLQREIHRLRTELQAAYEELDRLKAEYHRLREHSATISATITQQVEEIVETKTRLLTERLASLEQRYAA